MVEQGRGDKIADFSSQAGRRGESLVAVYCASKVAVVSLAQSTGLDLIEHKINVNGIAPGVIDRSMWITSTPSSPNMRIYRWAGRSARWASPALRVAA